MNNYYYLKTMKRLTKTNFSKNTIITLGNYSIDSKITFLTAVSYEERGFESLKRAVEKFKIKKVLLFEFNVQDYLDIETLEIWKKERNRVLFLLESANICYRSINSYDDNFKDVFKNIKNEISNEDNLIVDITTFPKNYILKICKELEAYNTVYQYTRGEYTELTEKERKVGISKIIPIDGFEGKILINESVLLVLILGFEGNRALPFLEEFHSGKILALTSAPGIGIREENEEDKKFIQQTREANKRLLNNSFVKEIKVNSLNPFIFCQQLKSIINNNLLINEPKNIVIAPIGTKAQTLGLYIYWRENPKLQILYPLPNRRPLIASKTGKTYIYVFS